MLHDCGTGLWEEARVQGLAVAKTAQNVVCTKDDDELIKYTPPLALAGVLVTARDITRGGPCEKRDLLSQGPLCADTSGG